MDMVLQALADPSRRTVLEILRDHPATAGELADALPIARRACPGTCGCCGRPGWSTCGRRRSAGSTRLRPEALVEVDEWLETIARSGTTGSMPCTRRSHEGRRRSSEDHRHDASSRRHPGRGARRGRLRHRHRRPVEACTTPERLARWIAEVSGDLGVGETVHAVFTSTWAGRCASRPATPRTTCSSRRAGHRRRDAARGVAHHRGTRTRLVVEERGLPRRPAPLLRSRLAGPPGGPRTVAGQRGSAHAEGWSAQAAAPAWQQRWTELTPAYEETAVR